jgi:hypothetical protein
MITSPKAFQLIPNIIDTGTDNTHCAICNRAIRYAFEAKSRRKDSSITIKVGVECAAGLFNPKAVLSEQEWIKQEKGGLIKIAHSNRLIKIIQSIAEIESTFLPNRIVRALSAGDKLTPKQGKMIYSYAQKHDIPIPQGLIPISMQSHNDHIQISEFKKWEVDKLLPFLTRRQSALVLVILSKSGTK